MAKKGEVLPSGKVRYRIYIGKDPSGRKRYKSFTADSQREAKKDAQQWLAVNPQDGPNISLAEACERFLEVRSGTLSPSTWADYKHRVEYLRKLFPDLFKLPIKAIDTNRMQWLTNELAVKKHAKNEKKSISAKTVNGYISLLKTILRTNGIRIDDVQLPQYQKPDLNIPETELVKRLLDSVAGTHLEIPVLLAALGPMRRGEICGLKMTDVDFANNIIHVRAARVLSYDGTLVDKDPKTAAGNRDILFPAAVIQKIAEQGYITHCKPNTISGNFARHLRRHGLPPFRFHDLRHYAASFLLSLQIPPVYVKERGGWESDETMRRYIHALEQKKNEFAEKAAEAFQSDLL